MKSYLKCETEIIDKGKYFWINKKDFEIESHVANWAMIFDKCDPQKQKYRQELTPNAKYQRCRVFVRNDLVERKIKNCRKSSKVFLEFKKKLGLDINSVTCDEQDIISTLQTTFEEEIIITQYWIENKRIDAYFSKYKLAIEVDEYNHKDRDSNYEKNRQSMIVSRDSNYEKNRQSIIVSHGITIIRTNPDDADFNINKLINQIYRHISQSNKIKLKKD